MEELFHKLQPALEVRGCPACTFTRGQDEGFCRRGGPEQQVEALRYATQQSRFPACNAFGGPLAMHVGVYKTKLGMMATKARIHLRQLPSSLWVVREAYHDPESQGGCGEGLCAKTSGS